MNIDKVFSGRTRPDLTPMIDVVFLLLIFFMVTTSLIKEEADLGIQLPTKTKAKAGKELPNRHTIDILPDGSVFFNDAPIASPVERITLHGLIATLKRVKATSDRMDQKTVVVVIADPLSPHFKSIEVLDACAAAGIKYVSFGEF
ncbi:biopolymer transporter ExbD [Rubellicoccus peritrichatus]|uniref:Biopolymer transporter ExbD n=1 Tax=Rubellicoccus peritrichatus TaxID=3080537 RepID=A0AAQ3QTE7_9BACT|nr:biopolymer transporter ExbD [Puniceicoccus sp. CR14]WOO43628.1 biopolymer transporter ExbD [Puniceicoccus sp. CR14]